eukprot:1623315-Pleurochrysis_carterae.AAC.1
MVHWVLPYQALEIGIPNGQHAEAPAVWRGSVPSQRPQRENATFTRVSAVAVSPRAHVELMWQFVQYFPHVALKFNFQSCWLTEFFCRFTMSRAQDCTASSTASSRADGAVRGLQLATELSDECCYINEE